MCVCVFECLKRPCVFSFSHRSWLKLRWTLSNWAGETSALLRPMIWYHSACKSLDSSEKERNTREKKYRELLIRANSFTTAIELGSRRSGRRSIRKYDEKGVKNHPALAPLSNATTIQSISVINIVNRIERLNEWRGCRYTFSLD